MPAPAQPHFEYDLDADDVITRVSPDWVRFARENEAPSLTPSAICGRQIWEFISDASTRQIYHDLFALIRARHRIITVPFRCDSPEIRRFMQLVLAPAAGSGIQLTGILLRTESVSTGALLDSHASRSSEVIVCCSFCKAILVHNAGWYPVEDAIRRLNLFSSRTVPTLSHSVCPNCEPELRRRLES